MRFGKAEIEANPDGIAVGGPVLEGLMAVGAFDRAALLDRDSAAFDAMLWLQERVFRATPAFAVATTPDTTRLDQLAAGWPWVRRSMAERGPAQRRERVGRYVWSYVVAVTSKDIQGNTHRRSIR